VRVVPKEGGPVEAAVGQTVTLDSSRALIEPGDGERTKAQPAMTFDPAPTPAPPEAAFAPPLILWQQAAAAAPWTARSCHASLVFDGKMWVLGGADGGPNGRDKGAGGLTADVWYSEDGGRWYQATGTAPWGPRTGHVVVVFDGRMWLLGGDDGDQRLSDVWYSTDGANWSRASPAAPWQGRRRHAAVVHDGRIWVLGGATTSGGREGRLNDVWSSTNGVEWTQTTASAPWAARYNHAAVSFNGALWVFGGDLGDHCANDVWCSVDGQNWGKIVPTAPWWAERMSQSVVAFEDRLWLMGGFDGRRFMNDVWCSPDGVHWVQADDYVPWSPRGDHTCLAYANRLWVVGGYGRGRYLGDIWR